MINESISIKINKKRWKYFENKNFYFSQFITGAAMFLNMEAILWLKELIFNKKLSAINAVVLNGSIAYLFGKKAFDKFNIPNGLKVI